MLCVCINRLWRILLFIADILDDMDNFKLCMDTMRPAWLVVKVCETILESYDESLLPITMEMGKNMSLKKIVSYLYLPLPSWLKFSQIYWDLIWS